MVNYVFLVQRIITVLFSYSPFPADHFQVENGEWNIVDISIIQEDLKFPCCPDTYSTLSKNFTLTRRSLYYFLYILLPLISLAFLFLMVFFIPHDSGERMGFGVTILLSITVYLLVISEALPEKSDDKSMLGICFIAEFYMLCGALVLSLLTMNLFKRKSEPPKFLVNFYNFFHAKIKLNGEVRALGGRRSSNISLSTLGAEGNYLHCNIDEPSLEDIALTKRKMGSNGRGGGGAANSTIIDQNGNVFFNRGQRRTYNEQWRRIAVFLDSFFFITVLIFICIVPMFITSALSRSGLA